jgi:hypothetical protein
LKVAGSSGRKGFSCPQPFSQVLSHKLLFDAEKYNYGSPSYWESLDKSAISMAAYFTKKSDYETANNIMTRSLSEALTGNNGN